MSGRAPAELVSIVSFEVGGVLYALDIQRVREIIKPLPVHRLPQLELPPPDDRAVLDRMPGSSVPVIRQPFAAGDRLPFWAYGPFRGSQLFDLVNDPGEDENLAGTPPEKDAIALLRAALADVEAPHDQLVRLGLV